MNTRNNIRRRASVERMEQAFLEQLREKTLPQIKVSDICKAAGVNRSTFYAVFEDVFDLAKKMQQRLERDVNQLLALDGPKKSYGEEFLRLFHHIRDNQELYRFYFKLGWESSGLTLYDFYSAGQDVPGEHSAYHILFFKEGFNAIVKCWLKGGCRESPEEMRDILLWEYRGRCV